MMDEYWSHKVESALNTIQCELIHIYIFKNNYFSLTPSYNQTVSCEKYDGYKTPRDWRKFNQGHVVCKFLLVFSSHILSGLIAR